MGYNTENNISLPIYLIKKIYTLTLHHYISKQFKSWDVAVAAWIQMEHPEDVVIKGIAAQEVAINTIHTTGLQQRICLIHPHII